MKSLNLVIRAAKFARKAHESIDQRRKYTGEPYFVHPEEVALLLSEYVDDPELIAAAYLHDTVEDVDHGPRPVTHEVIVAEFGERVGSLVKELTNVAKPSDGNRAARKAIERDRLAKISREAKMAKMCDIIANVPSVAEYDEGFAPVFLAEKAAILKLFNDEFTQKEVIPPIGVDFYSASASAARFSSAYQQLLQRATDLVNTLLEKVSLKT